jgi:hypothetical protein
MVLARTIAAPRPAHCHLVELQRFTLRWVRQTIPIITRSRFRAAVSMARLRSQACRHLVEVRHDRRILEGWRALPHGRTCFGSGLLDEISPAAGCETLFAWLPATSTTVEPARADISRWAGGGIHPVFGRDEVPTSLFRKGGGAGGRPGCRAIGSVSTLTTTARSVHEVLQ